MSSCAELVSAVSSHAGLLYGAFLSQLQCCASFFAVFSWGLAAHFSGQLRSPWGTAIYPGVWTPPLNPVNLMRCIHPIIYPSIPSLPTMKVLNRELCNHGISQIGRDSSEPSCSTPSSSQDCLKLNCMTMTSLYAWALPGLVPWRACYSDWLPSQWRTFS